jgi:hypothetical protein
MSVIDFKFNYKRGTASDRRTQRPVLDAESRTPLEVFYPFVPCTISSKKKRSRSTEGLLDSGSDGVVLPRALAEYLELDLEPATAPMMVADGRDMNRFVSRAVLMIGRAGRYSDPVEVEVSVPAQGNPPVLIGRNPIFRQYRITFIEAEKRLEMKPYQKE